MWKNQSDTKICGKATKTTCATIRTGMAPPTTRSATVVLKQWRPLLWFSVCESVKYVSVGRMQWATNEKLKKLHKIIICLGGIVSNSYCLIRSLSQWYTQNVYTHKNRIEVRVRWPSRAHFVQFALAQSALHLCLTSWSTCFSHSACHPPLLPADNFVLF